MRTPLACLLACCMGCSDDNPVVTLDELPDLSLFTRVTELPWTYLDPPSETRVRFDVLVFHDYPRRACPTLDPSFVATLNGVSLTVDPGGPNDHGTCDYARATATVTRTAELGTDVDVAVSDAKNKLDLHYRGLLRTSMLSVIEPVGALAPAAKVRLSWAPEDLAMANGGNLHVAFTQLAAPNTTHELRYEYALVDGNEIRLSIPDDLTWTGPTQLAVDNIELPYIHAETCGGGAIVCTGIRTAAAAITVELN